MTRRELLALSCSWMSSAAMASGQHARMPPRAAADAPQTFDGHADVTLRIGEITLDLAPGRSVRTLAYNGTVPGPAIRATRGRPLIVDVWNDTREEDIVHWHGLHIPPEIDGAYEEGTPGVPPRGRRRYSFTPEPAGTRW